MTRLLIGSALVVTAVVVVGGQTQAPVFRGTGESVPVFVTVTDKNNRIATNLTKADFQVLDNGRPQELTLFDNSPQPVRLILLLDVSSSMGGNLPLLREASMELFSRLRPGDLARVGTFGREIVISPEFTRNAAALRALLPVDVEPNSPTPLWKATDKAITELAGTDGRPVVLVLSDGKDTGPPMKWGEKFIDQLDVVDHAQRAEVMIYSIGLHSRYARGAMPSGGMDVRARLTEDLPDPGLGTVALETGGGYFEIRPSDDLSAAFARVADELHNQYLMGFTPTARDGKAHKIEVKLSNKDLKPRARKTYRAPKGS